MSAVRRHCQTMALAMGRPVALSHRMVVSRWLVMPMAAMSADVRRGHPRLGDGLHHHPVLGRPDLHGVLLHPALMGIILGKLLLRHGEDVLLPVKENGAGAGGALVQGQQICTHRGTSFCDFQVERTRRRGQAPALRGGFIRDRIRVPAGGRPRMVHPP